MEARRNDYIWDDINVGRDDFNNSENFFAKRHDSHEKENFNRVKEETHPDPEPTGDKENVRNTNNQNTNILIDYMQSPVIKQEFVSPDNQNHSEIVKRAPPNLMKKPWSSDRKPQLNVQKTKGQVKCEPPSAYEFKDTYQKRKEEKIKQMLIEEKKNREFHSRPVPNFSNIHENKLKKDSSNTTKVTVPVTPMVLKKSVEMQDLRRQKFEEFRKNNLPKQFVSTNPIVLHQEPFKPKIRHHEIQAKPFNFNIEKRLEERKSYDELIRKAREEKNKLAEQKRNQQEREMYKEFRKQTIFKATPNPFK